jgi:ZIP family zinc transporter
MSFSDTVILGTIAGLTIFLGLPLARLTVVAPKYVAFLNALAIGILFFLFFDIVAHAVEPVEAALKSRSADLPLLLGLLTGGFLVGLLSLVYYGRRMAAGPGFTAARLAIVIATGIGLHNFSEGLAIGGSAAEGATAFALILVVGFALHNATEGFGIAAPLTTGDRPTWAFLALLGLIGGGPTFAGGVLGYTFSSPLLSIVFLGLAAGALIFVFNEMIATSRKFAEPMATNIALLAGLLVALGTDFLLVAIGA